MTGEPITAVFIGLMEDMFGDFSQVHNGHLAVMEELTKIQGDFYKAEMEYSCYLDTVAPKLAHYYGYILGNELLPQIIPGYHSDALQTAQYEAMLKQYWGNAYSAV